jgi:hypothetical protein
MRAALFAGGFYTTSKSCAGLDSIRWIIFNKRGDKKSFRSHSIPEELNSLFKQYLTAASSYQSG